jgi:SulP family sulfate permease
VPRHIGRVRDNCGMHAKNGTTAQPASPGRIQRWLPITGWLRSYTREDLEGDLVAGIITAILLVPQGMAFAILAGLPAQAGLYASVLPPFIYALLGTSRTLAVGPVSVAALMVAHALSDLPANVDVLDAALTLALLAGVFLLAMGMLGMGQVANFLSHPVLSGFTNAAALLIIFNQLPNLTGVTLPAEWVATDVAQQLVDAIASIQGITLLIGVASIGLLLYAGGPLVNLLTSFGASRQRALVLSRAAPLLVVLLATIAVSTGNFAETAAVAVVGSIPAGLPIPTLALPGVELALELLPAALLIGLVGYVESVSIAKSLANRRRQRIDTNQELIALGMANIAGGVSGGMPVAGGFSRTMVNFTAGARTQFAAIITAILVGAVALFFTPLLENIPKAALAAIIIVAVSKLIDIKAILSIWRYDRVDGAVLLVTAAGVLLVGIEAGLATGIALSLISFALRAAHPHVAVLGRIRGSEHFRNVKRHEVQTWPQLLFLRVDENLTFANASFTESLVNGELAAGGDIRHVILVLSSVNAVDSTALEVLEQLAESSKEAGVNLHLSDVKGPVMDRLGRSGLIKAIAPGEVFLSAHLAAEKLG